MLIIHKFLFLILLLVCFFGLCNRNSCQINGNLEYLQTIDFIELCSADNDIILPDPYLDYKIPDISNVSINEGKVGRKLNICPPVALGNFSE